MELARYVATLQEAENCECIFVQNVKFVCLVQFLILTYSYSYSSLLDTAVLVYHTYLVNACPPQLAAIFHGGTT